MADFTQTKYRLICQSLIDASIPSIRICDYLKSSRPPCRFAILRHDIDRKPINALKFAQIEHSLGLRATYYFRYTPFVFVPHIIREIGMLGHEIGYHYETLSEACGDFDQAVELFRHHLAAFRKFCTISTISMHGRPASKWDNRALWKHVPFTQFGILGEAYLSLNYDEIAYYSDTGRNWDPQAPNLRDHVSGLCPPRAVTSDDLIKILNRSPNQSILPLDPSQPLVSQFSGVVGSFCSDLLINSAKQMIRRFRKKKPGELSGLNTQAFQVFVVVHIKPHAKKCSLKACD